MSPPAPGPGELRSVAGVLPRRRVSGLTIATMIVLGLGSLVIAVLVLLAGGPVTAFAVICLAAVSFPLLILLCFWLDRYEPEPARYRLAALGWGAVIAVAIGLGLEFLAMRAGASMEATTIVWAPVCEELGKGMFPLLIVLLRRQQLNGVLDGIVYAVLAGIGFAFTEDVLYYLQSVAQGGAGGLVSTFFLRGVLSPFAHPLFTSATGVGIGLGVMSRSRLVRVGAPVLGYLVAVLLHGVWNGSAALGGTRGFFVTYLVAFLPLLLGLVIIAVWARRREGRMLTASLQDCARLGWVSPAEIRWVATLADRATARRNAKRFGGRQSVDVLVDYQQTLTEMAFLHHQVLSGTAPVDFNARMYEIQHRAAQLRPYVILPVAQLTPPFLGIPGPPGGGYPANPGAPGQWSPIPGPTTPPSAGAPARWSGPPPTPDRGWEPPRAP